MYHHGCKDFDNLLILARPGRFKQCLKTVDTFCSTLYCYANNTALAGELRTGRAVICKRGIAIGIRDTPWFAFVSFALLGRLAGGGELIWVSEKAALYSEHYHSIWPNRVIGQYVGCTHIPAFTSEP